MRVVVKPCLRWLPQVHVQRTCLCTSQPSLAQQQPRSMGRVLRQRKAVTYNERMLELETGMGAISDDESGQPSKRHKAAVESADVDMADTAEPASPRSSADVRY